MIFIYIDKNFNLPSSIQGSVRCEANTNERCTSNKNQIQYNSNKQFEALYDTSCCPWLCIESHAIPSKEFAFFATFFIDAPLLLVAKSKVILYSL